MTKKRNLTTFMIAIMIMLFSLPANAQGKVGYAKWDASSTTLTFKGGESVPEGAFALNTGYTTPDWNVISIKESVTKVVFDESFKDVRPTSCYQWFRLFKLLTTIEGIENLNTENVTNMGDMFNGCSVLENLDLSSFNTANVTDMSYMFSSSYGLTSLDLSSFNTAKVENMSCMFSGNYGLTSLDLSSFNTAEVTNMLGMFGGCSALTSLDLSSFNTAKVTKMSAMFSNCSSLNKIYVSKYFATSEGISSENMFYNCTSLKKGDVSYDPNNIDHTMANYTSGYFTESNLTPCVKWNGDTKVLTFKVAHYLEGTEGEWKFNEGAIAPEGVDLKNNCKKVVFTPSFKQVKPTSCYSWFDSFSNLTTIQGIENLNTEEVKNMMYMFYGCKKLTSLDLSSFYTAKVTNMNGMFGSCSSLTSLDLSSFNTDEVTEMSYMFGNCTGLKSLDLSKFNTAKVWEMGNMFGGCSGLTSLNLSSFNTAKVTDMMNMFVGCKGLTSLDLSSFNTANVQVMSYMFNGCSGLTTINVSDAFTTNKVSNSDGMFYGCSNLKGATSYDPAKTGKDMANFDGYFTPKTITPYVKWDASTKVLTFKVANNKEEGSGVYDLNDGANAPGWSIDDVKNNCTNVVFTPSFIHARPTSCYLWFEGFEQLKVIEGIEYLNTEKVTNMSHMFAGCKDLTSLDLSSFNTAEVTNMSNMFVGCSGLLSLGVSSFNTANVTDMSGMFVDCSNLTSLDLSSFNTAKVTNMSGMFYNCSDLKTIYVSDDFTTSAGTSGLGMFEGCRQLKGAASYDPAKTGIDMANFDGYFTKSNLTPYVKWDANTKVLTFKVANNKEEGSGVYDLNEGDTAPGWSIDDVKNNCTNVVFTPSFIHAKPTSCYKWFSGFGQQLTTIEGIENLNTEKVTTMHMMFSGCSGLTSLNLSGFNTANVTSMYKMFNGCSSLESLSFSSFKTANVTTMYKMFHGCSGLESLDLSSFNTAKVTNMKSMFEGCNKLTSLNLSSFNTAEVTDMYQMFENCSSLTSLDLSNFDTANVTDMAAMFYGCSGLTSLNLSSFNTVKVTSMDWMFYGCSSLTSLDLSSFKTANVEDMTYMFGNCTGLKSLDLSSFNTAKVTRMGYMFYNCSGLTTIYVSDDFTTSAGTSGSGMFEGCTSLKGYASYSGDKIDKDMANYKDGYFTKSNLTPYVKWDGVNKVLTFKVANNKEEGAYDLNESATAPGWSIDEVKNYCTKVVFTSSFNHAKPTSCYKWFSGFGQLTTIQGIENLNTEEVKNMGYMFGDCKGLTSLDLSSFNTAKVEDMSSMFNGCSGLTKIYVGDGFTTGTGTNGSDMFYNCTSLVGAAKYSPQNKTDKSMANYTSGYFKTYFTLGENKVELCGNPLTTESLDLSGDYDFTPKYEFNAKLATYSRDLSTSGSTWFSLCLPFAYTPANFNFTAYKLKGASADAVEIEEITETIAAGTPVLFKFKDGEIKEINLYATEAEIVKAPVEGATVIGDDGSSLQLCGTYQTKTFSSEDNNAFILLNDKLMNPAKMLENKNVSKVSVKPFRAYMTLTAPAQTSSARAFSIGHGGEGNEGTTAIDLLNSVATDDAEYYDINGRRIDAPAKGVNIVRRGNKTMKLIIK